MDADLGVTTSSMPPGRTMSSTLHVLSRLALLPCGSSYSLATGVLPDNSSLNFPRPLALAITVADVAQPQATAPAPTHAQAAAAGEGSGDSRGAKSREASRSGSRPARPATKKTYVSQDALQRKQGFLLLLKHTSHLSIPPYLQRINVRQKGPHRHTTPNVGDNGVKERSLGKKIKRLEE